MGEEEGRLREPSRAFGFEFLFLLNYFRGPSDSPNALCSRLVNLSCADLFSPCRRMDDASARVRPSPSSAITADINESAVFRATMGERLVTTAREVEKKGVGNCAFAGRRSGMMRSSCATNPWTLAAEQRIDSVLFRATMRKKLESTTACEGDRRVRDARLALPSNRARHIILFSKQRILRLSNCFCCTRAAVGPIPFSFSLQWRGCG